MDQLTPDAIRPVHEYGDPGHISPQRAARMTADDADAFKGRNRTDGGAWFREWTQHEASHAIADRHLLMHELARALETIAKLAPYKLDLRDIDNINELPDGTLVQEWNGELAVKTTSPTGEALWQSPGDANSYRAAQLCYPLTVIPVPPVADDE